MLNKLGNEFEMRLKKDIIFRFILYVAAALLIVPLFLILGYVLKQGISVINWEFLISLPQVLEIDAEKVSGGIIHAIVGTFMLIVLASILAVPLGVLSGIYVSENKKSKLVKWVHLSVDILQGTPSIVIGIVAYQWFVVPFKGYSAFSGGIALAIMMLPIIIRSTEETLRMIPNSLKEASLALGVPYSKTLMKVILPAGVSGILTGIILGVARIAGETAPLLFTAFGSSTLNFNLFKPMSSLPHLIYKYASSPYPIEHRIAWGASVVLVFLVLGLNIIAKVVARKWKVQC
jgi:phosphate transport system permease protein